MERVLVTGVNGFVGPHVVNELHDRGVEVIGCATEPVDSDRVTDSLDEYFQCDLTDAASVAKLPWQHIDGVVHLAGLSDVGKSFDHPDLYMHVNTAVIEEQLKACMTADVRPRFVVVSTGAMYELNEAGDPITEKSPITLKTPYAKSKRASEELVAHYREESNFDAIITRPFNHFGPGQRGGFMVPAFMSQARAVVSGGQKAISVGDLTTSRDFTDVRDVARAYAEILFAKTVPHPLYNICSGVSVTGREMLNHILAALNYPLDLPVEVNKKLLRPDDVKLAVGSAVLLADDLGWKPEIQLDQTLADIVAYDELYN